MPLHYRFIRRGIEDAYLSAIPDYRGVPSDYPRERGLLTSIGRFAPSPHTIAVRPD